MPDRALPVAVAIVITGEACVVFGLMLPQTRAGAALLAGCLLLIYASAIAINLLRGRENMNCGCGGSGQTISWLHVVRNILLALFAVPAMAAASPGPTGFEVWAVAAACALTLWFTFLAFDQLLGNRTHAVATRHSYL